MNRRPHPYVTAEKTTMLWSNGAGELAARLSAGDMVSMDEAAGVAGVPTPTIESWAGKGRVIAIRDAAGAYRLPRWQFDPVLWPCISKLNQGLGARDGWVLLSFLETPLGALNGRTPRQAIEQGEAERVLALAREHL
ncbi:hypothetical protein [Variovorax gossypii]|nr:MAG: hypothetical protein EKK53_01495 [Burkholderiales bacterium]